MSISRQEFCTEINKILDNESNDNFATEKACAVVLGRVKTKATYMPVDEAVDYVEEELNDIIRERILTGQISALDDPPTPVRTGVRTLLYQLRHGW
jgi:hypothetical protein